MLDGIKQANIREGACTWLPDNKSVFSQLPPQTLPSSCHSLNFFSGDQPPASFEGRFDFGKSPRSLRGLSGQRGRRLVIKRRKEHPLDVPMGFSSARGRKSSSPSASRTSSEGGGPCWGAHSPTLQGHSWRPSRQAGPHLPGWGWSACVGISEGMFLASVTASLPCHARCQSQDDTSCSPLPHVF